MSRRPLRRLPIDQTIVTFLATKKIATIEDVLILNLFDLLEYGITYESAKQLMEACTVVAAPSPKTAKQLLCKENRFLKTSLKQLDEALSGGLPVGSITEVAGPAGCGKTQFCMMLAVVAAIQTRNREGGVLYLDTEGSFSSERLLEIARGRFPDSLKSKGLEELVERYIQDVLRNVFNGDHRLERLDERIVRTKAQLIILDSAASLLRKEFHGSQRQRGDLLSREAMLLKQWSEMYCIPCLQVVVTNQVTTRFDDDQGGDAYVTAALGNTWAHSVNTRMTVSYSADDPSIRIMRIIKSPLVAPFTIGYCVSNAGLTEIDEVHGLQEMEPNQVPNAVRIRVRRDIGQVTDELSYVHCTSGTTTSVSKYI
eukprot:gene1430-4591_t